MTKQEFLQVAEWIADGVCEYQSVPSDYWIIMYPTDDLRLAEAFQCYRRKPQPKYRPWKPEEVPVGHLIILKEEFTPGYRPTPSVILGLDNLGINTHFNTYTPENALIKCMWSTDHGKTWLPCGVEE